MGTDSQDQPIRTTIEGSSLCVLERGPEMRAHLVKLIDEATASLDLYYYIFADDESGTLVRDALIAAARRGVAVTLMIDSFGSATTPRAFFDPLVGAGARLGIFGMKRATRYLIRNHQKLAIADHQRLLVGGFNVSDAYFGEGEDCWRDVGLWLEGPAVTPMVAWYDSLAAYVLGTEQRLRPLRRMVRRWQSGEGRLRWLVGGPTQRLSPWARCVREDLIGARRLDMAQAYFSPGPKMTKRIDAVSRRGQTRLVMAAKSDNGATVAAARFLYGGLLRKGARIWEYSPCRLHMKLIIIDDIVYIGSANFDMRSLYINLELMLRIEDKGFADAMSGLVDRTISESREITPEIHHRREGPLTLLKWWISYLLVGSLDYTVTRRLNFKSNGYPR